MQLKKQQLELTMEPWTGSKLRKEYIKAVYCHPAYLTYNAEYIMRNAMLLEAQAGIKIAWRNINILRYADDTTLMEESDQISHSVVSDSLRPHESQHARPPCPSPTPGVHPDSRPSSQ